MKNKTMRTYKTYRDIFGLAVCLSLPVLTACSPDDEPVADIHHADAGAMTRIELKPQNTRLIADGKATLDLLPLVYYTAGEEEMQMLADRVGEDWFEYTANGQPVGRYYSTKEQSLVGKQVELKVVAKDNRQLAGTSTVTILAPAVKKKEYVIPVVFHVIRERSDEERTGLVYEKALFDQMIERFNKVFAGEASTSPVGVDTYIRFKAARFAEDGTLLLEPGVNRVLVDDKMLESPHYAELIRSNRLNWNPQRYLNIWLFQRGQKSLTDAQTGSCKPAYRESGATEEPQGLALVDYVPGTSEFAVDNSGIIYQISSIKYGLRSATANTIYPGYNELIHYVGTYLGLLPSFGIPYPLPDIPNGEDYCDDTVPYMIQPGQSNEYSYKTTDTCHFLSENLMDDPTGFHNSVSKQQAERMHWVLEHCPDRWAWKSDFAFVGK